MDANVLRQAELYRMVTNEHICPFGLKSKDLLRRHGYQIDDHKLTTRADTDAFKRQEGVETTPQTFIDGTRIGGYNDLLAHFGKRRPNSENVTYKPVIAVFATAALMALSFNWATFGTLLTIQAVEWFIAISMCVLAILKLRDIESFSNMFLGYDLLAQRYVPMLMFTPLGRLSQAS
jgi:glutaredoxin